MFTGLAAGHTIPDTNESFMSTCLATIFAAKKCDRMTPDIVCWRLLFNAGLKRNLLNQLNHTLECHLFFASELNNPKVELLILWPSHPSRLEASRLMSATVCLKALLLVPYPRNVVICGAPVAFNCPASKWRPFKLIQKHGWQRDQWGGMWGICISTYLYVYLTYLNIHIYIYLCYMDTCLII